MEMLVTKFSKGKYRNEGELFSEPISAENVKLMGEMIAFCGLPSPRQFIPLLSKQKPSSIPGCFDCNHYTAKGKEKDSAFSYPKPQLMLTKPKLNVPLWDKKLPKVDKNLPSVRWSYRRIKTK